MSDCTLKRTIESDRLYIQDRGYAKFTLFNAIIDNRSSYVCRFRDNSVFEVAEERPLTEADRAARVVSDQIVRRGLTRPAKDRPNHPLRLVIVKIKPHISKGKYKGGSSGVDSDGFLRIATNLLDVPAEIIALLYEYRWTIEIKANRPWRLSPVQAPARLPSPAQPQPEWDQDSGRLRGHRLPADLTLDGPQADETHARNAVLPDDGLGHGGRCRRSRGQAQTPRRTTGREKKLTAFVARPHPPPAESLHAAHSTPP